MPLANRTTTNKLSTKTPRNFIVLIISALFLVSSFLPVLSSTEGYQVSAQTQTPLEKAQSDYSFQFTKYRDSQEDYYTAKAAYLSFKTAVAKTNAYTQTKDYLIQTCQLYIAFINLVKENGNIFNWNDGNAKKDEIAAILDTQKSYFENFQTKIQNTKTLEELPPLASELNTHVEDDLTPKLNMTLATYQINKTSSLLFDFNTLSAILDRIVIFKLRSGETKSILANWSSEIKDIKTKTETNLKNAQDELDKATANGVTKRELDVVSENVLFAQRELKRSKPLFEELIRIL